MKKNDSGTLYIVPTPIGNLDDISNRVIKILSEVNFIVCEDTRRTLKLLNSYNIKNTLISHYKENEIKSSDKIINLLIEGNDIGLVSDSGTPLISDPGSLLIRKAIENNVNIISVPGPTALTTALVASGFDLSRFNFYGFLSKTNEDLNKIKNFDSVTVIYESPHRLIKTLELIADIIPDRDIVVAKEISKINESYFRGKASDLLNMNIDTRGEFVIIIDKNDKSLDIKDFGISLKGHLAYYVNRGLSKNDAIKHVAKDLNLPKNDIYKLFTNE